MLAFRVSTVVLMLTLLLTAAACGSTDSASPAGSSTSPTGSPTTEAAPAGRFTQCLSIGNYRNAEDPAEMRAHAEALRALDLDDDLRGPADALARSYDELAASLDDLDDDPTGPDGPTDLGRYEDASDRYNDANGDVRSACREEQPTAAGTPADAPGASGIT